MMCTSRSLSCAFGFALVAWLGLAGTAFGHIVLAERSAPAGSYFKVTLRVPHGCDGAATTGLSVAVPDTVVVAKPMVKPGWRIETTDAALVPPVTIEGHARKTRTAAIAWRDGSLADDRFDDFVFLVRLPGEPGPLAFPVIQTCGATEVRWDQAVVPGAVRPDHPAPVLTVTPKAATR